MSLPAAADRRDPRVTFWLLALAAVASSITFNVTLTGCDTTPNPSPSPTTEPTPPPDSLARSCAGCHTDEALLKEVATPLPPPAEDTGEG